MKKAPTLNDDEQSDDFLEEENLLTNVTAEALKRVLAWQIKNFLDYVHKFHEMDLIESFFLRQVCFTHFAWNYSGSKMDFIGKTEDLQGSCDYICKELNIESKKLPYLNKSKHKHWSEYYDYDAKKLIGSIYDMDFKYFGYEKQSIECLASISDVNVNLLKFLPNYRFIISFFKNATLGESSTF